MPLCPVTLCTVSHVVLSMVHCKTDNCWQYVASLLSGLSKCLLPMLSTLCQMSLVLAIPSVTYSSSQITNNNPLICTWYNHNLRSSPPPPQSHDLDGQCSGSVVLWNCIYKILGHLKFTMTEIYLAWSIWYSVDFILHWLWNLFSFLTNKMYWTTYCWRDRQASEYLSFFSFPEK